MRRSTIRAVVLDFDGVILESVDIKTQAFLHLFSNESEEMRRRIARLHLDHGGVSRYEKFARIYRDLLQRELPPGEMSRLDDAFSRFCRERVLAAPFVAGAREFLERGHREYLLFIVSGTPEAELRATVEARGLTPYVQRLWGSPADKADACGEILAGWRLAPAEVAFVGDAVTDFDAARRHGIHFIARLDGSAANPLEQRRPDVRIADLSCLGQVLVERFAPQGPPCAS